MNQTQSYKRTDLLLEYNPVSLQGEQKSNSPCNASCKTAQVQPAGKILRHNEDRFRYYTCGDTKYASATTLLNEMQDKSWMKYVNLSQEALLDRRNNAAKIGTAVHQALYEKLSGLNVTKLDLIASAHVSQISEHLNKISDVRGLEKIMKSDTLKVAGTADVIATYDGVSSVIDFKTTRKPRYGKRRDVWYLQAAMYAFMHYEQTNFIANQIVIIESCEDGKCRIHKVKFTDYADEMLETIQMFYLPESTDNSPTKYLEFLRRMQ